MKENPYCHKEIYVQRQFYIVLNGISNQIIKLF